MERLKAVVAGVLCCVMGSGWSGEARADVYHATPKLVVLVVIDQFRGDYLDRFRDELTAPNGFNLFLKRGAYFNNCMYGYANTKTAPGHATIGTGAYTDGHGIGTNEWWDLSRNTDRVVTSVEDERYRLLGTFDDLPVPSPPAPAPTAPKIGASPLNEQASTIGDEVRLATGGTSRVYGVALKDRAAVLMVGQSANAAYWIDQATGRYETSTYYMGRLPEWVTAFNKGPAVQQAVKDAGLDETTQFYALVGRMPAANRYELRFAEELVRQEHLGAGKTTDVLAVSLSANDIEGHQMGPDSDQEREMVQGLDRDLSEFFTMLDKTVGLENVVVALTADHGVAPVPAVAARLGMAAARLDLDTFATKMNEALHARYGAGSPESYLMPTLELPYLPLDERAFAKVKVDEKTAEETVAKLAPEIVRAMGTPAPPPNNNATPEATRTYNDERVNADAKLVFVRTKQELAAGKIPRTEFGELLAHSYTDHGGWYVMMIPQAYQMELLNGSQTTHFSPWSYDRHVPLAFFGGAFVPGTYREATAPVDIAATLASLLGVNRPSAAVGRVLTEALKPGQ